MLPDESVIIYRFRAGSIFAFNYPHLLVSQRGSLATRSRAQRLQRLKMIPWLADSFSAVLDGFRGTIANAGHAVCTGVAPDRFASVQGDVFIGQRLTHWLQPLHEPETVKAVAFTNDTVFGCTCLYCHFVAAGHDEPCLALRRKALFL